MNLQMAEALTAESTNFGSDILIRKYLVHAFLSSGIDVHLLLETDSWLAHTRSSCLVYVQFGLEAMHLAIRIVDLYLLLAKSGLLPTTDINLDSCLIPH